MNNNNLNNEYFKLTIRLLKEHKLYNKLLRKESFSKIPLESVYDIIALPKKLTSYIGLLRINELDYYSNFKNDYNEKIKDKMKDKYKEVFYLSLNNYKRIIKIEYSKCNLKKLKKR